VGVCILGFPFVSSFPNAVTGYIYPRFLIYIHVKIIGGFRTKEAPCAGTGAAVAYGTIFELSAILNAVRLLCISILCLTLLCCFMFSAGMGKLVRL
jgi:hypothetical protein